MTTATRAIDAVLELLTGSGIAATRDVSELDPSPIGVLIGLPSLVDATLGAQTFEIPVYVVSGDPVNSAEAVDRLYAIADEVAVAASTLAYRPTTWGGRAGAEPLPALELTVTVTVSNEEV